MGSLEISKAASNSDLDSPASTSPLQDMLKGNSPELLECDYDLNCTELYKAIENSQWEKILSSESMTSQASVWVVRKEKNGRLKWRLLPLHAALIFRAPFSILELLLECYPHAASQKDDQGNLPLHLALRNEANWEILEELMTVYPTAVLSRDRKGRTPLEAGLQVQKSAEKKAALKVIELYTNIRTAKISSEVKTSTLSETDQQIKNLQTQHLEVLNALRNSFYAEQDRQQAAHEKQVESLTQQLNETKYRLKALDDQFRPDSQEKHFELLGEILQSQKATNAQWKETVESQSRELEQYQQKLDELMTTIHRQHSSSPPRASPRPRGPVVERRVEELESHQKLLDELLAVRGDPSDRQHHSSTKLDSLESSDERRRRSRSLADEILEELDASSR